MPRILLTGGTGFIGRHLTQALLAVPDVELTLLVQEKYGMGTPLPAALAPLRPQLHLVYADLRTFNLTVRAVKEAAPEIVIHLAAQGATDPFMPVDLAIRHNLTGTLNLLRASFEKSFTATRFITARTTGELTAMNSYAASKAAAWQFCRMYTLTQQWPITGAMIFQCFGPGQPERALIPAAIHAARAGQDFPMTAGTQKRDFIYVDDVVAGLQAMTTAETLPVGDTLDLGTGIGTSLADVVTQIYALVGQGGRPLLGTLPTRPGERPQPLADVGRTQQFIDWRPEHPLKNGLSKMLLG